MAARESAEMKKARKLILEKGLNAKQASKVAGITSAAIYSAPWYKAWKLETAGKQPGAQSD